MQSLALNAVVVAATSTIPNILAGSAIQYMGKAGVLTIYGNGDAAGLMWNLTTNDGQQNQSLVPQGSSLGVASTAGAVKTNENFIGQFAIPGGVQLSLAVTNPTGAPINANFLFAIT
jgi:hypothetical protein